MMQLGGGAFMAIGQGTGPNKASAAIEQALHHPLLESVALEEAAGVIVHFTGGKDLSLFEVSEALEQVQDMTGGDIELVMGITHDEMMQERAQVIMVITGLGAQSLEDVLTRTEKPSESAILRPPKQVMRKEKEISPPKELQPVFSPEAELTPAYADLDMPAFLRKRARNNDSQL
jgi:cell division protein FtsZ